MEMRFDMATVRGVRMHPAGFLLVDARPTRTGVLEYRRADGSVRREYRPPEEVFKADSLATLRGASVTIMHPAGGRVSPENVSSLEVGSVMDSKPAGRLVASELIVKRSDAISKVNKKELVELSCGYSCNLDMTPGVTPEGERYDAVQRDIRYNHVALLPKGTARGGSECAIRLDSNGAIAETEREDGEMDQAKFDQAVQARVALEQQAATVLGDAFKPGMFEGLSDRQVMEKAVKQAQPNKDLSAVADDYVRGTFDSVVAPPRSSRRSARTVTSAGLRSVPMGSTTTASTWPTCPASRWRTARSARSPRARTLRTA